MGTFESVESYSGNKARFKELACKTLLKKIRGTWLSELTAGAKLMVLLTVVTERLTFQALLITNL